MMSRVEIKSWAKEHVNGKRIDIWKSLLLCYLIIWITYFILGLISAFFNIQIISILTFILSIFIVTPLTFGICNFFKNFVVDNTTNIYDITSCYKDSFKIVILSFIVSTICMLGYICFVIPGIIFLLSFIIIPYIYENNRELGYTEILKLSYDMMKGHKLDFIVMQLSFIG